MDASQPPGPVPFAGSADRLLAAAARAGEAARARLGGCVNDLFRPIEHRLSDRDHALMTRMLPRLATEIETALRQRLDNDLSEGSVAEPHLSRSRGFRDTDLAALLLRRCDEHHLARRLQQAVTMPDNTLERHACLSDPEVAEPLARLFAAESARVDDFGDPLVRLADMPAPLLHRLGWRMAGVLRDHLVESGVSPDQADHLLARAMTNLLSGSESAPSVDRLACTAADALDRAGWLDERLVVDLLLEGQLMLWIGCLSHLGGIAPSLVSEMLADAEASRLSLLFRGAGVGRVAALDMIAALLAARYGERPENGRALADVGAAYDLLDASAARIALGPWRQPAPSMDRP